MRQQTLQRAIRLGGVGLHLGKEAHIVLHPAPVNTGIRFQDAHSKQSLPATIAHVQRDTFGFCTRLHDGDYSVATVEHLLAALSACKIHNCIVETSSPEIPVLDGSSAPIVEAIAAAGTQQQEAKQPFIEILQPVHVVHDNKAAALLPRPKSQDVELVVAVEVDFRQKQLPREWLTVPLDKFSSIAAARTFTFREDIEQLWAMKLAQGGSLDNAVVFQDGKPLNTEGLRNDIEWVQHKALDCFGDLALAGMPMHANFTSICPGHALTHELLHKLLNSPSSYRVVH